MLTGELKVSHDLLWFDRALVISSWAILGITVRREWQGKRMKPRIWVTSRVTGRSCVRFGMSEVVVFCRNTSRDSNPTRFRPRMLQDLVVSQDATRQRRLQLSTRQKRGLCNPTCTQRPLTRNGYLRVARGVSHRQASNLSCRNDMCVSLRRAGIGDKSASLKTERPTNTVGLERQDERFGDDTL